MTIALLLEQTVAAAESIWMSEQPGGSNPRLS